MAQLADHGALLDSDPGYFGGRPVVRGTHVTVQRIVLLRREGRGPAEIADDYDVPLEAVEAALSHYEANRAEIDHDIEAQDAEYDRLAAEHERARRVVASR